MTLRNTPSRKERAALYWKAAKLMEKEEKQRVGRGACWAVIRLSGEDQDKPGPYLKRFKKYIAPEGVGCGSFWYDFDDEGFAARVVALCFMAAMVEAGDA